MARRKGPRRRRLTPASPAPLDELRDRLRGRALDTSWDRGARWDDASEAGARWDEPTPVEPILEEWAREHTQRSQTRGRRARLGRWGPTTELVRVAFVLARANRPPRDALTWQADFQAVLALLADQTALEKMQRYLLRQGLIVYSCVAGHDQDGRRGFHCWIGSAHRNRLKWLALTTVERIVRAERARLRTRPA
jgi:hypothetical protein